VSAIRELLKKHLPTILPQHPEVMRGTVILKAIRSRDVDRFSDQAFRCAITQLSKDDESCCQKAEIGQGYHLRVQHVSIGARFVRTWKSRMQRTKVEGRLITTLDRASLLAIIAQQQHDIADLDADARHTTRTLR
jgi:hypothetical protein